MVDSSKRVNHILASKGLPGLQVFSGYPFFLIPWFRSEHSPWHSLAFGFPDQMSTGEWKSQILSFFLLPFSLPAIYLAKYRMQLYRQLLNVYLKSKTNWKKLTIFVLTSKDRTVTQELNIVRLGKWLNWLTFHHWNQESLCLDTQQPCIKSGKGANALNPNAGDRRNARAFWPLILAVISEIQD